MMRLIDILTLIGLLLPVQLFAGPLLKNLVGQDIISAKSMNISADGKKGLVVVFLSAKCPCSNSHVTELKELAAKYTDFAYVAIHSNADESRELAKPYFEKAGFSFPVLEDKKNELADLLQAFKTPHAFILLPSGIVAYQGGVSNGADCTKSDRKYLREALEDIQVGRIVRTPESRTLGCVIFRGENNVW